MTVEVLGAWAGVVLSLFTSYIPGWDKWYGGLEAIYKRIIMLVLLFGISAGAIGIACAGWADQVGIAVTCDYEGAVQLGRVFLAAMIANQGIYKLTKKE